MLSALISPLWFHVQAVNWESTSRSRFLASSRPHTGASRRQDVFQQLQSPSSWKASKSTRKACCPVDKPLYLKNLGNCPLTVLRIPFRVAISDGDRPGRWTSGRCIAHVQMSLPGSRPAWMTARVAPIHHGDIIVKLLHILELRATGAQKVPPT